MQLRGCTRWRASDRAATRNSPRMHLRQWPDRAHRPPVDPAGRSRPDREGDAMHDRQKGERRHCGGSDLDENASRYFAMCLQSWPPTSDKSAPHTTRPGAGVRDGRRWVAGAAYGSSHRITDGGNTLGENQCDHAAPEPPAGHPRAQCAGPTAVSAIRSMCSVVISKSSRIDACDAVSIRPAAAKSESLSAATKSSTRWFSVRT